MKGLNNTGLPVELKITGDGSHTLFVPGLQEHYHSVFGAVTESNHIFIEAGFNYVCRNQKKVQILEIGFGTGLNALLTYFVSVEQGCDVEYTAIELNPVNEDIYSKLNYQEFLKIPGAREIFMKMHETPWGDHIQFSPNFLLKKIKISLEAFHPAISAFDLIYFDAFGPDIQPEMWTAEVFIKMATCLKKQGVLVTYSTKGTVKRNLSAAGFLLEKLPGPIGKREILRAVKT